MIMKRILLAWALVLSVAFDGLADIAISDVKARQRYPWNGLVDIAVTIQGTAEDMAIVDCVFAATNSATKAEIPVEHITRNGEDTNDGSVWTRKFIWDTKADVGAVKIDDVALTVDVRILGVQLWENGPYWAECNVGATKPEEYGYYFWWGDTVGYKRNANDDEWISVKDSSSFLFRDYTCPTYNKSNSDLQSKGYIDSTCNLVAAHDAARAHLGTPWRMPTDAEFSALISNCTTTWTTRNGVNGRLVTGKGAYASKSIFLPATGYGNGSALVNLGSYGGYWSSTLVSVISTYAWGVHFKSDNFGHYSSEPRYQGQSVRPVRGFADSENSIGITTHLPLDCSGAKVVNTMHPIVYDASWYEDGTTASVTANGQEIASGVSGSYAWAPTADGVYLLTLNVSNASAEVVGTESALCLSREDLTELVIPEGTTEIGEYAFAGGKFTSVTIPSSVAKISPTAFVGCKNIQNIRLDSIPAFQFGFYEAEFNNMKSYSADNDIKANARGVVLSADMLTASDIASYTMYGYAAYMWFEGGITYEFLAYYDDKSSIKVDENWVVQVASIECKSQTGSIRFDNGGWHWIEIRGWNNNGNGAAYGSCSGVKWRRSGETAWRLFADPGDGSLFRIDCTSTLRQQFPDSPIKSVTIGEGVETIPSEFFKDCALLESVSLPSSITKIGEDAFLGCDSLKRADVASLEDWLKIKFANEAANPIIAGAALFVFEEEVTEIVIPEGTIEIGDYAFAGGKFTSVTIPSSVATIGKDAFAGCENLKKVYVQAGDVARVKSMLEGSGLDVANISIVDSPVAPIISPASGSTFDSSLTINIACATKDAKIFYTLDGSEPTPTSAEYKRFKIKGKTTVKAIAYIEGMAWSEVTTAEYALGTCANPTISAEDGTVFQHSDFEVSIAWNESDGVLRYTLDGSEPTAESPIYEKPFTISETTTVKAKVFSDDYFDSEVVASTLTREWLTVATPVISAPSSFSGSKTVASISCGTPGATIRYTTDGSEPNSHSKQYKEPFEVTATSTIKAYATMPDFLKSEVATATIEKIWGIGDALNNPDMVFVDDCEHGWRRDTMVSKDGVESMRSGAIGDSEIEYTTVETTLSTTLKGKGTFGFWWKASCEEDEDYEWDHGEFRYDGKVIYINGIRDWSYVEVKFDGDGEHTVTWAYVKDDFGYEGEDCIWVDCVSWKQSEIVVPKEITGSKDIAVDKSWFAQFPAFAAKFGEDLAVALTKKTGKKDANGSEMAVWQDYVAGTDPTDPESQFKASVEFVGGKPVIKWTPDLNEGGAKSLRVYKTFGAKSLGGLWEEVSGNEADYNFFKVTVEMP